MKIRVNYDLIDKIRESKTGVSLKKTCAKRLFVINFAMCFNMPIILLSGEFIKSFITSLGFVSFLTFFYGFFDNKDLKDINIDNSTNQLKQLAILLRKHYINTDYELLQKVYEYETNYKFVLDENKIPRLKQDKYIMVPVVDRDGEKEVSLVQEYLFGSKDYELSYGSPTKSKVLKPVFNC